MSETVALIVAAGRGERAGGATPKQYQRLAGKAVLRWAINTFTGHPNVDRVLVVIGAHDDELYRAAVGGLTLPPAIIGGVTRQGSGGNGLEALAGRPPARVLIHDGARPLVSRTVIGRV